MLEGSCFALHETLNGSFVTGKFADSGRIKAIRARPDLCFVLTSYNAPRVRTSVICPTKVSTQMVTP